MIGIMSDNINKYACSCWCGSEDTSIFYEGPWFYGERCKVDALLVKCLRCGTVRTAKVAPKITTVGELYSELSYRHIASIKTICRYARPGSLLDIGCNTGLMLKKLHDNSKLFNYFHGIDTDTNALATINDTYINKSDRMDKLGRKFDNILLLHVLEHVYDYGEFFKFLDSVSEKDAMIYIAVPNLTSLNARRNLSSWGALNPVDHRWHYTSSTIVKMIKTYLPSAKLLKMKTSWIWPHNKIPDSIQSLLHLGDQIDLVLRIA